MKENEIGAIIVDTAVCLHQELGPGLLESVYEVVLMKLLVKKGLYIQRQVSIPIEFEGEYFDEGFRLDLFVDLNFGTELMKDGIERIINGNLD